MQTPDETTHPTTAAPDAVPVEEAPRQAPAVFFDRDNTLIIGADYLGDPAEVTLMPGAAECVAGARRLGYRVVAVSNQSGVARGYYDEAAVHAVNAEMDRALREADLLAVVDRHEFCPHHPQASVEAYRVDCECRKPRTGMLLSSAEALDLDLSRSWLVGDAPRDIEAGAAAGCRTILLRAPDLEQSPAALAEHRVAPDFTAESLVDVLEIIGRETPEPGEIPDPHAQQATPPTPPAEPPQVPVEPLPEPPPGAPPPPPAGDEAEPSAPPSAPPSSPAPSARQASSDQIAQATAQILDDLRRSRQTPVEDFNWLRLLAGVTQVMALAALVMGLIDARGEFWVSIAIFIQLMTLTLLTASK